MENDPYVVIDTNVVEKAGASAAIFYSKLCKWHLVNKECGFERYNFSTLRNIHKLVPYFTYEQIRSILRKLKEIGFVDYDCQQDILLSPKYKVCEISHKMCGISHEVCGISHEVCGISHEVCENSHEVCGISHEVCENSHEVCENSHEVCENSHEVCGISHTSGVKEKQSPHTPYKKKDKEEYILSSESDNKLSSSSDNNIQNLNNFSFVSSTRARAREEEKEKKEVFQTQKKDVFEEFFTNTIYREGVMKNYGLSEKAIDYGIRNARKSASCFIDGITRREAQVYIKNELEKIPPLKGELEERKKKFFNEVLRCAMALNIDEEFAVSFYSNWSQLAIPELEVMRFENELHNNAWDTTRRLAIANTSYKKKNEKYY